MLAGKGVRVPHRKNTASMQTAVMPCPEKVVLPMKQHIGAPCDPIIADGEHVTRGQLIGKCPDGKLGTNLHASIDGPATVIGTSIRIVR